MPAADRRARSLALTAAGLARGAGMVLPFDLELWRIAGGRPAAASPIASDDPAGALVAALERSLTSAERTQGAHYTPADLADRLVQLAAQGRRPGRWTVVDPACGGGAILLAAGRHLVAAGLPIDVVARDLLWGADVDPLAAAVTDAAIALWSRGTVPATGHVAVADALVGGRATWPTMPKAGFDLVVGNPPFQGQLSRSTTRSAADQARLRARFGDAVGPYVDTAALFLLAGVDLAARGGRVALVQPRSTAAARDAGPVRAAVAARARLTELWAPRGFAFAARVHVCVPVLAVGRREPEPDWGARLAEDEGVPAVELPADGRTVGHLATAIAPFRQHYYGLVPHVREAARAAGARPLVTSGLLDVGRCAWGRQPVRFAGSEWRRPSVDRRSLAKDDPGLAQWVDRLAVPKVLVASQTKVVEAAADRAGRWVPCTPVVSVLPKRVADVDLVAAALNAPPAAAWAAARAAGTGLSPGSIRMSADLALSSPLPPDRRRWRRAADALAAGDLDVFATLATDAHQLPDPVAECVLTWWRAHVG